MILRNMFLNTASFLMAPPEKPDVNDTNDQTAEIQQQAETDSGDVTEPEAQVEQEVQTSDPDEDDDPDLADLPPEVRAKAKAAIEKKVAKETAWRDKQIDRLYRKTRETKEDVQALETIADPARRAASDPHRRFTQDEVQAEAQRLTAQQQYDRDANAADDKGRKAYGDKWGTALSKLPKLGGVDVNDMVDILATDQPHVVLYHLSDPDEYERVMGLPPARRRNEFVKLSLKEAPKARVKTEDSLEPSNAPPPVRPISNGRRVAAQTVDLYNDKVDDDAWYAARNASRRKKFSSVE